MTELLVTEKISVRNNSGKNGKFGRKLVNSEQKFLNSEKLLNPEQNLKIRNKTFFLHLTRLPSYIGTMKKVRIVSSHNMFGPRTPNEMQSWN